MKCINCGKKNYYDVCEHCQFCTECKKVSCECSEIVFTFASCEETEKFFNEFIEKYDKALEKLGKMW